MTTGLKTLGFLFAVASGLFTACALVDYCYRLNRGSYFEVSETEDDD